jgi:hypothetical protein
MAEKDANQPKSEEPSFRTRTTGGSISANEKRFDIFLIDTRWNEKVSKLVQSHLPIMYEFQKQDALYILTPEQSAEIIRREPALIGRDPTIMVYDLYAQEGKAAGNYRGFRIHLGRFRHAEQALARLQEFLRFVNTRRAANSLDSEVRKELHREGMSGAVKLLWDVSEASIELI